MTSTGLQRLAAAASIAVSVALAPTVAGSAMGCGSRSAPTDHWKNICELPRTRDFSIHGAPARMAAITEAVLELKPSSEIQDLFVNAQPSTTDVHLEQWRAALAKDSVASCLLFDYYERAVLSDQCGSTGDPAVCLDAAARYASQKIYPAEESKQLPALYEQACVHGSSEGCLLRAALGDQASWLAMACRRGDQVSCARGRSRYPGRVTITQAPAAGPITAKITGAYVHAIADCYAAQLDRDPAAHGHIAIEFGAAAGVPTKPTVESEHDDLRECIGRSISIWRFDPGAGDGPFRFAFDLEVDSPGSRIQSSIARAKTLSATTADDPDSERFAEPTVALYSVEHEYHRAIATGDVWATFQRSLYRGYKRCYRQLRRKHRSAAGKVVIAMTITASGRVGTIKINSSFDRGINDCVRRRTASWRFPVLANDVGARLVLTVGFSPKK